MDIGLLSGSPLGANFMPSSSPPHPSGLQVWPDTIDDDFYAWIHEDGLKLQHRKLITGQKRAEYSDFLKNQEFVIKTQNQKEHSRLATIKWAAMKYFELQQD